MVDFVFNSASVPLTDKSLACGTADDIFLAITNYIGDNSKPKLFFDEDLDKIFLSDGFSFFDYYDGLLSRNRELAEFMAEFWEYFEKISNDSCFLQKSVKVGDDTRFLDNLSLKYACLSKAVLVSVSEERIWRRGRIQFFIYDGSKTEWILYNLFSSDYSYLPVEIPPFSIFDKRRFKKTHLLHEKQAIYQEIATGHYWYNDVYHKDNKAHFEVFDKTGVHIAEASMDGEIDYSKADKSKRLNVD
ncbi:MAG: hypothetical protein IK015_00435 [Treponema sp.]|nr:hypothetical protein [Treponema sp.]